MYRALARLDRGDKASRGAPRRSMSEAQALFDGLDDPAKLSGSHHDDVGKRGFIKSERCQ